MATFKRPACDDWFTSLRTLRVHLKDKHAVISAEIRGTGDQVVVSHAGGELKEDRQWKK